MVPLGVMVYDALLQYKAEHGNLHVPVAFRVPSSPPWHQDLWGLALGQRCSAFCVAGSMLYGLRRNPDRLNRHPEIRAEITALGFSWKVPKRGRRKSIDTTAAAAAATYAGVDGTAPRSRGRGRNEALGGEPGGVAAAAAAVLRPSPPPSDAAVVVLAAEGVGQDVEGPSRLGDGAGGRGFDVGGEGGTVVSDGRSEGVRARSRAHGEDSTTAKTNKGSVVANGSSSCRNRAGRLLSPAGC
ncbi:unnamed protein product [Ectocarpus sp. CCAP 1310/34]|nr:unnamed protein product [Ectocarpus sp. CCAP 1310/34]